MNKQTVKQSWDSYQRLCLAAATDHRIAEDPAMQWALKRAHDRWARDFNAWDGR